MDFFPPGQVMMESAGAGWLGYAHAVFTGHEGAMPFRWAAGLAVIGAAASVLAGGSSLRRPGWRLPAALAALFPLIQLVAHLLTAPLSIRAGAWLAGVMAVAALLLRTGPRLSPKEAGRWLAVLLAATLLAAPFYTFRPIGSGDAHWYTLMLADFTTQIRAGIFPVWVGQTEYAFNGAVNPLRLAPWYQHFAALLDLLTAQRLHFIALKNALLAINLLLVAGTAYACLRRLLPAQSNVAVLLALLFTASPAVLAPVYVGDQYMTFLALPFGCLALHGLVAVHDDDRLGNFLPLCAGLAGLWLTHTPLALWLSFLLFAAYTGHRLALRPPHWHRHLGLAFLGFLLLGSYPVISVLSLENTNPMDVTNMGTRAAEQVVSIFPQSFLPLLPKPDDISSYQLGYSLLGLAVLGSAALFRPGQANARALAVACMLAALLLCPMPAVAKAIWPNLPDVILQINGSVPQQRFFPIIALLVLFLGALAFRSAPPPRGKWAHGGLILVAAGALAWSGYQAAGLVRHGWTVTDQSSRPAIGFQLNNLSLTRYAFASFAITPSYYSHGYINPLLEHRLLRSDQQVLIDNHEGATHPPAAMLLAEGDFTATNDNQTAFYLLSPRLELPARQQLALKVEPLETIERGWFQVSGQDVFREYILPDSGTGTVRRSTRGVGTLPESSRIIPLRTWHPGGETPRYTVILPDIPIRQQFTFARFELWQFDAAQLPVTVRSWAPYRLHVRSPAPALLETPRSWLPGYYAEINGHKVPVQQSADGLAQFPVPAGESDVAINYAPQWYVTASYWLTLGAWVVALGLGVRRMLASAQRTSTG